MKRVKSQSMIY